MIIADSIFSRFLAFEPLGEAAMSAMHASVHLSRLSEVRAPIGVGEGVGPAKMMTFSI